MKKTLFTIAILAGFMPAAPNAAAEIQVSELSLAVADSIPELKRFVAEAIDENLRWFSVDGVSDRSRVSMLKKNLGRVQKKLNEAKATSTGRVILAQTGIEDHVHQCLAFLAKNDAQSCAAILAKYRQELD